MARPNMRYTIELPGDVAGRSVEVRLRVIADTDAEAHAHAETAGVTVGGSSRWKPNDSGVVTFTSLRPTSGSSDDVITTPEGAVYEAATIYPDGRTVTETFTVPDSAGTYNVADYLTDPPGTLPTAAVTTLQRRVYANRIHRWACFGHSFHRLGADSYKQLWQNIVAGQVGAALRDFGVSGSDLTNVGETAGGMATTCFYSDPPALAYGAQVYPKRPGVASLISAINAIQAYGTDGDWDQLLACLLHAHRAWLSWQNLSAFWLHDAASTGQTFGGAGWSTGNYLAGLAVGPQPDYARNSSSGRTITVVTSTAMAGLTASLFFLTNRTGGGVQASDLTFTLDGVAAYPTGFSVSSPFSTADVAPSSLGSTGTGLAAARFALPDDGATHTIVATTGTGGVAYCGWGVENPRILLVGNCARRSDAGYTPNGSDAKVTEFNTELEAMIDDEFGSPAVLVDIDTALDATAAYFSDGFHPNNEGHAQIAAAFLAALDAATFTAAERMVA